MNDAMHAWTRPMRHAHLHFQYLLFICHRGLLLHTQLIDPGQPPPDDTTKGPLMTSPQSANIDNWRVHLTNHLDQRFAQYILCGIEQGFQIGFDHQCSLVSVGNYLPSAGDHQEVVPRTSISGTRSLLDDSWDHWHQKLSPNLM